jgi:hypothetical protein
LTTTKHTTICFFIILLKLWNILYSYLNKRHKNIWAIVKHAIVCNIFDIPSFVKLTSSVTRPLSHYLTVILFLSPQGLEIIVSLSWGTEVTYYYSVKKIIIGFVAFFFSLFNKFLNRDCVLVVLFAKYWKQCIQFEPKRLIYADVCHANNFYHWCGSGGKAYNANCSGARKT